MNHLTTQWRCSDNLNCTRTGGHSNLPDFELYAFDYLNFAEKRLNNIEKHEGDIDELINCVAHLKRAVDCQLDTFFHSIKLYKTISDRNLKFEKKLDFLKGIGIFNSRSLGRLNTLRNKMEHHYEVPKIGDIELYYDLVSAFISVLQSTIITLTNHRDSYYSIPNNENPNGFFYTEYDDEKLEVIIKWALERGEEETVLKADISELDEFIYFFKVHLVLTQLEAFATWEHIYSRIKLSDSEKKKIDLTN